jgi:hypothetical protein
MPVCWYTADERERDLGLFVEYLVGAIGEQMQTTVDSPARFLPPRDWEDLWHCALGSTGETACLR